jgi:hypothetical protein
VGVEFAEHVLDGDLLIHDQHLRVCPGCLPPVVAEREDLAGVALDRSALA